MRPQVSVGRLLRAPLLLVMALSVALSALVGGTTAASAAPVYELTGEWEANTPGQPGVPDEFAGRGDVVTALWRINVNSDLPAPTNDLVDNVFATVTLENGVFTQLPAVCLTGGAYTPQSSVSADRRTLVCNIGSVHEGTAVVLQSPIVVDGATGSNLTATATFNGLSAPLPPVPIRNGFGMDMLWGTASTAQTRATPGNSQYFDFEWTLFQENGSDAGPNQVTYDLTIASPQGQPLELGQRHGTAPYNQPCTPFTVGVAAGHPYNVGAGTADQQAPFVDQCTLTQTGPTTFRMTLTGIDYSLAQVPTRDSAGQPLPVDRTPVATGSIWLKAGPLTQNISVELASDEPLYTSTTGLTDQGDPSNNTSTRTVVMPGTWSHSFGRTRGGSTWDNSYTEPAGATTVTSSHITVGAQNPPPGTTMGVCVALDTQFVTYDRVALYGVDSQAGSYMPDYGTYSYYVGNDPTLTPGSGGYDPNAFTGCGVSQGWTDVEPADDSLVKAVRWTAPAEGAQGRDIFLQTFTTINPTTPIGQDVWTFGAYMINGNWDYNSHDTSPAATSVFDITPTPSSRYPYTTGGRDKVRVIGAYPAITKSVDRSVVRPGDSVNYALTYSANGSGAAPTVDAYRIVDHLPVGMTYLAGSASPAPAITTDPGDGHQILTWTLNGVATNVQHPLTYQAVAGSDVTPGQPLVNVATSSLGTETSTPASAQVTVSTAGHTQISKVADTPFIPNLDGAGDGEGSWTVTMRSFDPLPNAFTDVIDILPWEGDERGTDFDGDYDLSEVEILGAPAGTTVYYTTADPAMLNDNPHNPLNGTTAGDIAGNTSGWTTTYSADATAVRVIGPNLAPGATRQFRVHVSTEGASPQDSYVNRAQGSAEHTRLSMRTSAAMQMAPFYSASLKKYVQDLQGNWHDAQDATDYPAFRYGDTVRYRVVVENTGQGTLRNIVVSDDKQPALGAFTVDSLAPGESESHEYEFVLDESTSGTVVNTASATADTPPDSGIDTPPQIPSDPAGIEITNYTTAKSSNPAELRTVKPGDKVTYTVKVTQQGDAPAHAVLTDNLSDVLDDATYNGDATADIGTVNVQGAGLSWSGTIPDGEVATITYSVTVKPIAQLKANGNFGLRNVVASPGCDPKAGEDADCDTSHAIGAFEYSKTSNPRSTSTVAVGDTVTYTVGVKQIGTAAVRDATLSDDLSKVLDDADYNGDAAASSGSVSVTGTTLSWTGDLAVGASASITYSVTVANKGDNTLRNLVTSSHPLSVCVPAADQNAGCTTTHTKATEFDLRLKKSIVSGPRATVGDKVRYRLEVVNRGPGVAPAPIKLTDKLPAGLELVKAKGRTWDCTSKKDTDRVVCELDRDLMPGQKAAPVFVVARTTRAAAGKRLVNVATVSVLGDEVKANNKDKAKVKVKAAPALPQTGFRTAIERSTWLGGLAR